MAREQFQTLTEPMYYILMALSEECCGVDIMERVRQISGGRVKVGPGTLYTMLSKFEENQIISLTKEEGRRKSYVITEHGRENCCRKSMKDCASCCQIGMDILTKTCYTTVAEMKRRRTKDEYI